jgi:Patatin-like phospholipase
LNWQDFDKRFLSSSCDVVPDYMGAAMRDPSLAPYPASATALNLAQALWDERHALLGQPLPSEEAANNPATHVDGQGNIDAPGAPNLAAMYPLLNEDNRWAICLSGGGIRSAAFALGIMQCFAQHRVSSKWKTGETEPVLQQFDYLSTVSGGGYVGSWFSAWLFQDREEARNEKAKSEEANSDKAAGADNAANDEAGKEAAKPHGASAVLKSLHDRAGKHDEAVPITNLRRDSHYLAPSFSAISPDVWGSVATVVRNLFLNWALLVPPMILAVLVTQTLGYIFVDALSDQTNVNWIYAASTLATLCFVISLAFSAANRPTRLLANSTQAQFLFFDLLLFIVGAGLLAFVLANPRGRELIQSVSNSLTSQLTDAAVWAAHGLINIPP